MMTNLYVLIILLNSYFCLYVLIILHNSEVGLYVLIYYIIYVLIILENSILSFTYKTILIRDSSMSITQLKGMCSKCQI